jgi:thiosulfate/3-mercaptopyruvate sulfurtransferase
MRKVAIFTVIVAAALPSMGAPCGGHGTRATMLVTTKWLADHLSDPNLVVIGVGQKSEFDAAHIPGSQFLNYTSIVLPAAPERPNSAELPPMADLAKAFGDLGVSNDSRIVLYMTKDAISLTTRVYLTLDAMGLGPQASLLDGGFLEWQREGRPVTTEVRAPKPGRIEPCAQTDVITDVTFVKANLHKAGVGIVDSRTKNFYTGETPGRNQRPGHIPGAVSVPYLTLLDETGKFRSPETMAKQFEDAGVKKGDRVVSYCHIGQQATVVYFAARYLGYDARMYDGSFEEWSRMTDLIVEK